MDSYYISAAEIASNLKISKMTVYRMLHSGEIPSIRVGNQFRINRNDYRNWINDLKDENNAAQS